jgi:hypothetical protein
MNPISAMCYVLSNPSENFLLRMEIVKQLTTLEYVRVASDIYNEVYNEIYNEMYEDCDCHCDCEKKSLKNNLVYSHLNVCINSYKGWKTGSNLFLMMLSEYQRTKQNFSRILSIVSLDTQYYDDGSYYDNYNVIDSDSDTSSSTGSYDELCSDCDNVPPPLADNSYNTFVRDLVQAKSNLKPVNDSTDSTDSTENQWLWQGKDPVDTIEALLVEERNNISNLDPSSHLPVIASVEDSLITFSADEDTEDDDSFPEAQVPTEPAQEEPFIHSFWNNILWPGK